MRDIKATPELSDLAVAFSQAPTTYLPSPFGVPCERPE
jgi:hypothetical protein